MARTTRQLGSMGEAIGVDDRSVGDAVAVERAAVNDQGARR